MKSILQTLLVAFTLCAVNQKSTACVDYHPDSVVINILADTIECNFIIEISNLNMFGGNPNDFCSCGISNAIPGGSTIQWVAFVDAETNEPVEGFDLWNLADAAGDSWEDADPGTIDWNGLVSGVNSAGIVAGQDVNLWIVLDIDDTNDDWNWLCNSDEGSIWETFGQFSFGTDEWDNDAGQLADTHQDITNFYDGYMTVTLIGNAEYQEYIDILESFYNSISEVSTVEISIYPNPASDIIQVTSNSRIRSIVLMDLLGKELPLSFISKNQIDVSSLSEGIYLLKLSINGMIETRKVKITH